MRDIKEEIKQNSDLLLSGVLVELVNTSVSKKISARDIIEYLNYGYSYENEFLEKINKDRQLKVETVSEAVEIFGPENCSFLLMNMLLFKTVENFLSEDVKNLFEMQLFTASASYIIAKETNIAYPHTSYSSGLLSNISYFYLARYHSEKLSSILTKNKIMVKRMTYEWETFGIDHAEMSYLILGSAGIMPEIYNPVRYHHQKNLQENIGSADTVKDVSLSLYFGSILTNMFYEDLGLVTDFKKDMKNMTGLHSRQLEKTIDNTIEHFKNSVRSTDIEELNFPGYFRVISWFDTKLAVARSQVELANRKNTELNLQNEKYQKALSDNNKKLVDIALTDPLTGAYNRRYLDEKLRDEFKRAKRYNQSFILISCDIDHFKKIN
ncbi:MAG: HDOD domain-containing protein, partial [Candidatus Delongbacteria bacterium]